MDENANPSKYGAYRARELGRNANRLQIVRWLNA
jgi:hypothetical protein